MPPVVPSHSPRRKPTQSEKYALAFGAFLGIALLKFGNPAILDKIIAIPATTFEVWSDAWPLHWANWVLLVLALMGGVLGVAGKQRWPAGKWLWILPMIWIGWQFLSALQSNEKELTSATLWELGGCIACYFLGALVLGEGRGWRLLLPGLLAAFTFCLMRAVDQRLFEFPRERQILTDSEKIGWTNMPPDMFQELKRDNVIINSNGVDVSNPVILAKYGDEPPRNEGFVHLVLRLLFFPKPRINGTLVYPNALAGAVLLLFPLTLLAVFETVRNLRPVVRSAAIGLAVFLGLGALFWSGSKGGWLVALCAGVFWLCRLNWPKRFKQLIVGAVLVGGLVVFGVRFQSYFAKGATSVGARFDYWRVAVQVAVTEPVFGSGPGTFQRPYAQLKQPESEMARLVHNDYLEQFSDSGFVGGVSYLAWIVLALWVVGRRAWVAEGWMEFAMFVGVLSWFVQGFMEFSLYVPALAWTAFTLLGCLLQRLSASIPQSQSQPVTGPSGKSNRQTSRP